ncbi:hypothetical protein AVEN_211915-1 [Araneus ventricosus]|uniref:Uncharacterized protein n=1 Tax=Araneus ventricosus TaxID=182803 RepID=A0A4Y2HXT4_ARAVE|nr:hypothetical protein AVEN_103515-1 [Araneus ventricosus]GBM69994.1 hypothetical protein AVEN_21198-1 [Araneus ventricosus]GBM70070.1 hypothetical protein AVEN_111832-1 [Araneus ventricosus]GBM70123.1 hypothetical protein AVEN_211915-1 [Araneus ventricosus]
MRKRRRKNFQLASEMALSLSWRQTIGELKGSEVSMFPKLQVNPSNLEENASLSPANAGAMSTPDIITPASPIPKKNKDIAKHRTLVKASHLASIIPAVQSENPKAPSIPSTN